MRAVLLAAGLGSRLLPLTRNTPKSLIDLGEGFTLLERQLGALVDGGVDDVVIVTGYKALQIEAKILDLEVPTVTTVFNPFFRTSNNAVSAWFGMRDLSEDVMLINGDDVFSCAIVERLVEFDGSIGMAVSRKDSYDEDDMKVRIEGGLVADVRKSLRISETDAESIGMTVYRGAGLSVMQNELDAMMRNEDDHQLFYLEALRRVAAAGERIVPIECSPHEWAEIDFHPDLEFVQDVVARSAALDETG